MGSFESFCLFLGILAILLYTTSSDCKHATNTVSLPIAIGAEIVTSHNFRVLTNISDCVIGFSIAELVSDSSLGYIMSCVVAKHTM